MNIMRNPKQRDVEAVQKALERVHLIDFADRQVGQLSGGQRKRVFVARALAQGASILLLDEPFAGVDAKTEASLVGLLRELQKQNVTTLIAAHDLNTIGSYCDHIILLKQTVIASGPTKKVFTNKNIEKTYDSVFATKKGLATWNS
jgi:manganese/iron transport system ATP-binding protein